MMQRNAGSQLQPGSSGLNRQEGQVGGVPTPAETGGFSANLIEGEQYLIFSLMEQDFAFPAEVVQGVERLADVTSVPNVVSWVAGVINLRGSICSVVDLRSFLDMERLPYNPRTRLLSVKYNEMFLCLVVDSVSEMLPIQPKAIDGNIRNVPRWVSEYSSGIAVLGRRRVILLDAGRLLFSEKMHRYSA